MKPPTRALVHALVHALFLLLVVGQMAQEVVGNHAGYKNNHHHEGHHHQGHHEGHHHHSSSFSSHHEGHHRAPRTRREKEAPGEQTESEERPGTLASMAENPFPCTSQGECSGLQGSTCDTTKGFCTCPVENPILDIAYDVCVTEAKLNEPCKYNSQCEEGEDFSICGKELKCVCKDGFILEEYPNVGFQCVSKNPSQGPGAVDPAMIGVLVGLALMFVIICVVLRLFSKARFRENRSIFNTPNPRLMNASLFKDSGVAGRRGSAMSTVSATGSVAHGAPKTPSPAKEPKTKSETTVAIENVD